jgi:hypothetical protein
VTGGDVTNVWTSTDHVRCGSCARMVPDVYALSSASDDDIESVVALAATRHASGCESAVDVSLVDV